MTSLPAQIATLLRITARLEAGGVVMAYPEELPSLNAALVTLQQHERLEAVVKAARQWRLSLEDDGWDEKAIMGLARPGIYALFSALAALDTAASETPTGMSPNNPSERAE